MKKVLAAWLCIAGFSGSVKAQLLWRVTHPVTQKMSFLFGTMHLAGFSYFEKHPAPLDSLKQCSRVITEAEMSDRGAMFTVFRPLFTNKRQRFFAPDFMGLCEQKCICCHYFLRPQVGGLKGDFLQIRS
jgi:hypothetical protein